MESTIIRKGATASIILGLGALFSTYSSSAVGLNDNYDSNFVNKSISKHTINSTSNLTTNGFNTFFSTYIYEDKGHNVFNVPIIKVYIDGQPVKLILDTGDSGIVINQSVVNIPSSDYISHSAYSFSNFGDIYGGSTSNLSISGVFASATICLNPSITSSCVIMPIGVLTSGTLFPGEPNDGVFGLAGGRLVGYAFNGNSMTAFSYPYYLEEQTNINSYQLRFISLSNNYYANVSPTQPIGKVSFGDYNGNSNTLTPYRFGFSVTFGSYPTNMSESNVIFDTASPLIFLHQVDLQAALATTIPNYSHSKQEGSCVQYSTPLHGKYNIKVEGYSSAGDEYIRNMLYGLYYRNYIKYMGSNVVNSGYTISYSMQSYTGSFVTEPPASFCYDPPTFNLLKGITLDNEYSFKPGKSVKYPGDYVYHGFKFANFYDIFGLPAMLGHTFTYVLGARGSSSQGIVQYLGISP